MIIAESGLLDVGGAYLDPIQAIGQTGDLLRNGARTNLIGVRGHLATLRRHAKHFWIAVLRGKILDLGQQRPGLWVDRQLVDHGRQCFAHGGQLIRTGVDEAHSPIA